MSFRKLVLVPESRYIRLTSNSTSEVIEDTSSHEDRLDQSLILKTVPKNFRVRAEALLDHLSHANVLSWNKKGTLLFHNRVIPHSNISDLIRYCMREYTSFTPCGLDQYARGLAISNIPESLIGNRELADQIHLLKTSNGETKEEEDREEKEKDPQKSLPPPGSRVKSTWARY